MEYFAEGVEFQEEGSNKRLASARWLCFPDAGHLQLTLKDNLFIATWILRDEDQLAQWCDDARSEMAMKKIERRTGGSVVAFSVRGINVDEEARDYVFGSNANMSFSSRYADLSLAPNVEKFFPCLDRLPPALQAAANSAPSLVMGINANYECIESVWDWAAALGYPLSPEAVAEAKEIVSAERANPTRPPNMVLRLPALHH